MNFAPLLTTASDVNPPADAKAQWQQRCSPRSMYSLSTAVGIFYEFIVPSSHRFKKLGIEKIKEDALKDIRSKLTTSNVAQELFTTFAAK
jgi:hypothetical protein